MPVVIPVLKPPEQDVTWTCRGKDTCSQCSLYLAGTCPGCLAVGGRDRCRMADCHGDCGSCGGFKVDVPAICIKSPVKQLFLDLVDRPSYNIQPGKVFKFTNKAIIAINGGKRPIFRPSINPLRYANVEAIMVSLWRCWSTHGWYSSDLKDYFGVPKRVKLILTNAIYDDALERATKFEVFGEIEERTDIDGYIPLAYSIYSDDSVLNQYFQWKRTLKALEETGGDWVPVSTAAFSMLKDIKAATAKIRQVHFYNHLTAGSSTEQLRKQLKMAMFWNKVLPKDISFWFEGVSSYALVAAYKQAARGRDCYFISSAPWMASHKGYFYDRVGKLVRSHEHQDELTARSIENFSKVVEEA